MINSKFWLININFTKNKNNQEVVGINFLFKKSEINVCLKNIFLGNLLKNP